MQHLAVLLALFILVRCESFSTLPKEVTFSQHSKLRLFQSSTATEDDILKPSYDIEPLPMRIGHGFDIHRMAPIQEAGQPVVIGGVTIEHKDQKVCQLNGIAASVHVHNISKLA